MKQLNDIKTLYFLGIGGMGMSALARYFHARGMVVHGYDRTHTPLTEALENEGMHIHYEDDPGRIPEAVDLVVRTPAVPESNAELQELHRRGVPMMKRAELLGLISRHSRALAVAGTHGKTTTSSMLTWLLHRGGLEPTAFLGGIARNFESNYVPGRNEWIVVEADEFDRSFLHLHPEAAAILSVDPDHLDIYGTEEAVWTTGYKPFAEQVRGRLVVRHDLATRFSGRAVWTFGIGEGDVQARRVRVEDGWFVFDLLTPFGKRESVRLALPGRHNVLNALAATGLALEAGADLDAVVEGLATFKGIWRRFDVLHRSDHYVYVDDYAHHPAELEAALRAARELFAERHITAIFQPHLFSRTRDFMAEFAKALSLADELILLDIYPAREEPIEGVTSDALAARITDIPVVRAARDAVPALLAQKDVEVVMTLGAGDIDRLRKPIAKLLAARAAQPQDTMKEE